MSKITAIETQKKRGNRKSIFVDGEFVVGANEDVIAELRLGVGQDFDPDRLAEIVSAETKRKACDSALRLLSYRARTVSEIKKRLTGNDFPEEIVEEVVEQLTRAGLLDDEKFSKDWVTARSAAKPMGKNRLAWELRSKGVDKSLIKNTLEEIDEEAEYEMASSLVAKKLEKAEFKDAAAKNRLISFLKRRGFGWEVISKVLDELLQEN